MRPHPTPASEHPVSTSRRSPSASRSPMPPLTVSSCRHGHRVRPNAERKGRTPERDGSVSAPTDASRAVPPGAAFPGSGGSCSPSLVSVTAPRRAAAGVGALGQPPGSSRSIREELGIWEMRCAAQGLLWLVPARQTLRLLQGQREVAPRPGSSRWCGCGSPRRLRPQPRAWCP